MKEISCKTSLRSGKSINTFVKMLICIEQMRSATTFLTSSQTSMNVLAIQDLSVVFGHGGGHINFPLQQLHTVVSWVRYVTLYVPSKGIYLYERAHNCRLRLLVNITALPRLCHSFF